jgi:hypothetical protein
MKRILTWCVGQMLAVYWAIGDIARESPRGVAMVITWGILIGLVIGTLRYQ